MTCRTGEEKERKYYKNEIAGKVYRAMLYAL